MAHIRRRACHNPLAMILSNWLSLYILEWRTLQVPTVLTDQSRRAFDASEGPLPLLIVTTKSIHWHAVTLGSYFIPTVRRW